MMMIKRSLNRAKKQVGSTKKILKGFSTLSFKKKENYYTLLELETSATKDEVKKGFRKMTKKYHPDVGGETADSEKFKEVVKAYETLRDKDKRTIYDLSLQDSRFSEEAYSQGSSNPFVDKKSADFYLNKWYQYKKPTDDLRFQFTEKEQSALEQLTGNVIVKVGVVILLYLIYDFYKYQQRKKHDIFVQTRNEILESENIQIEPSQPRRDEQTQAMEDYILQRIIDRETLTEVEADKED